MSDVSQLRALVQRSRPSPRRHGYPVEVRAKVVAFATAARASGASWPALAAALDLSVSTLSAWCASASCGTFLPVVVAEPERVNPPVVLISPGGWRVEGLGVGELRLLLRDLS